MNEHERQDGLMREGRPTAPAVREPPPLFEDLTSRCVDDEGNATPLTGWHRLASAADFVGRPRQTFGDAVERGEVPYVELDGVRFFAEPDLVSWYVERLDPEEAAKPSYFRFEAGRVE